MNIGIEIMKIIEKCTYRKFPVCWDNFFIKSILKRQSRLFLNGDEISLFKESISLYLS